ncbi:hypothetical protein SFR_4064 [Streptomyces sp. FR-008]|nr:hypothetical protein SFR_4064 [Streptomyces sp. FR-008]
MDRPGAPRPRSMTRRGGVAGVRPRNHPSEGP